MLTQESAIILFKRGVLVRGQLELICMEFSYRLHVEDRHVYLLCSDCKSASFGSPESSSISGGAELEY